METVKEPIRIQRTVKSTRAHVARRANDRMAEQVRKVRQDVQEFGGIARDVAQEKLEHLRDSAADYKDQGRDKVQKVERTIEQFIQDRPLKTVLIAAGVGLLLGRFWMRR